MHSHPVPLNGPSHIPPSPTHALILLHGFGADGHDLAPLAAPLIQSLGKLGEGLAVFSPHAPSPDAINQGRQWFRDMGWTFNDPQGIAHAATLLEDFLTHITTTYHIPRTHIALMGFSQGAMTLLYTLPTLSSAPAAAISHSGAVTVAPRFHPAATPVPTLFLHGLNDDVLPADRTIEAENLFKNNNYPTQLELLEDLAHGISPQSLAHVSLFLQSVWK